MLSSETRLQEDILDALGVAGNVAASDIAGGRASSQTAASGTSGRRWWGVSPRPQALP